MRPDPAGPRRRPAASLDPVARRQFLETLARHGGRAHVAFPPRTSRRDLEACGRTRGRGPQERQDRLHAENWMRSRTSVKAATCSGKFAPLAERFVRRARHVATRRVTGNEAVVSRGRTSTAGFARNESAQQLVGVRGSVQDLNLEDIFLELHHG